MEAEFNSLEEKITQLVQLCSNLRAENRTLRQQVLGLDQENQLLRQKVDGAKERVAALLNNLPEETE
jgi:cell division protein ZapB